MNVDEDADPAVRDRKSAAGTPSSTGSCETPSFVTTSWTGSETFEGAIDTERPVKVQVCKFCTAAMNTDTADIAEEEEKSGMRERAEGGRRERRERYEARRSRSSEPLRRTVMNV